MVQSQRLSATSGERMERGGFHGYQKTPNANSGTGGLKLSEINMRLSEMNHNGMGKNTNIVVNNNNNNHSMTSNGDDIECTVREQDRFMPIANVIRIMRRILPPHAKISDDAKETIQECVSEYISFITGEANERCQREQRKTITAEDVLWAMSKLGFDDYIEPLTLYLHRYREMEGDRGSIRSEPAANFMVKRAMGDHYGSGTFASFAPTAAFHLGHHHHQHGFFAIPNGAAAAASTSSSQASQQPAGAAVANGDHHAHAQFK